MPDDTPNPGGRPTLFRPEYIEQAGKLASLGAIDVEIADFFGVTEQTLNNWKLAHPKFFESIKIAKENADKRVEQSLYKRALGFERDSVKVGFDKEGNAIYAPFREYVVPDPTSMIFWLKNRRPADWRDKQEMDLKLTDALASRLNNARKRIKS